VMEYLQGQTLAQRLEKGPLPQDEALRIATEIADALHQAHKQGVVHRDLKPGNIMLTSTGAKLLDFGLAKSTTESGPAGNMTAAPTMTSPLTVEGTVVGTFQYMAPEQLEGAEASTRSDIFAFGAVLYEMLTGVKPFAGKTQASLVAAILKEQPTPLSQSLADVNPALERMVANCLEKNPEKRRQSMHDVLLELRWLQTAGSAAGVPAPVRAQRKSRERTAWVVAVLAAVTALAMVIAFFSRSSLVTPGPLHVNLAVPEGMSLTLDSGPLVVSPDGTSVAFLAQDEEGTRHLWVRRLDRPDAQRLDGTEGAHFPFWSPDSRDIAFFASSRLMRVPAGGGPTDTICSIAAWTNRGGSGGAWSPNGTIILNAGWGSPLRKVSASGGEAQLLTSLKEERSETHRLPSFLPDGEHYLFSIRSGTENNSVAVGGPDGTFRELLTSDSNAIYVAPGYLLYWRESALRGQAFDASTLEFTGEPFLVVSGVALDPSDGAGMFSASTSGVLAYLAGESTEEQSRLILRDRSGEEFAQIGPVGNYYNPRFSFDGRRLAVDNSSVANNGDIWLYDLDQPTGTRLTTHHADESEPIFSPDGRQLAFISHVRGPVDIHVLDLVRGGAPRVLIEDPAHDTTTDWSPDGRYILITRELRRNMSLGDIVVYDFETEEVTPLVATEFHEYGAQFSPDGKWVAYTSDESGEEEVYLRQFPEGTLRRQVSVNGGYFPRWSEGKNEIIYLDNNRQLATVTVTTDPELNLSRPVPLFAANQRFDLSDQYDVTPDGQTFLVNTPVLSSSSQSISLILNWYPADAQR
jgi:Tol biopolymer transport system component